MNVCEAALRYAEEAELLAFDVETSGVDWRRNCPVGYVLTASPTESVYVPIRHAGGGNVPGCKPLDSVGGPFEIHPFERDLARAMARRAGRVVGHNIKFDLHFAANAGVWLPRNLSDTQVLEAMLDEYARGYGLDDCARRHGVTAKLGARLYEHLAAMFGGAANRSQMANFWRAAGNDPLVTEYAAGDGVTTWELYHSQCRRVEGEGMSVVKDLEDSLIMTLFRMERRGIAIDEGYAGTLRQYLDDKIEKARSALPEGFNPRSPVDVREYMAGCGRTDWPLTDKGNPSFTEKWLNLTEEGRNIVAIRKWTNLLNSFVEPLLSEHVHQGRVHATFNQLKSDEYGTPARLSCSRPNLQQVPKRDREAAPIFRRLFVADPGMRFYEADYSQAEPRLFGHYSAEPVLVEGYSADPPRDMHQVVAERFGVERDPTAKRMNMGILTGMGLKSLAGHMGWTVDYAAEMWDGWFNEFPGIRDFQVKAKQVLRNRGYVKTLLGRRGRLEDARYAYRAVSKIIQGGNADIIKYKLVQIDRMLENEGDRAHLLLTVHDSIGWQAPDDEYGRDVSKRLVRAMEDVQGEPFNLRIPFKADVGEGTNWAEATFG